MYFFFLQLLFSMILVEDICKIEFIFVMKKSGTGMKIGKLKLGKNTECNLRFKNKAYSLPLF